MVVVYVEKYQGILMLKSSFWQVILLYTYSNGGNHKQVQELIADFYG